MKLTLYKNCKLNNAYKNVFAFGLYNNDYMIDRYLNTLSKAQLTIDNVYQENNGELNFEINGVLGSYDNIYEYNYMKVVSDDNTLLRYCFIDDISISNEIAIISYSEDIWHSFGKTMSITKSFLTHNRLADKTGYFNNALKSLPLEYENNNKINIVKMDDTNTLYNVVVEAQIYEGSKVGEVKERSTFVFIVDVYNTSSITTGKQFNIDEAQEVSQKIISAQSLRCISKLGTLSQDYYININEIFIVPVSFGVENYFYADISSSPIAYTLVATTAFWVDASLSCHLYIPIPVNSNDLVFLKQYTINSDFKIKSIGTFGTQIEVLQNGYDFVLTLYIFITKNDFKLFMNFANQMIEITDDFKYNCPFTAVNGEENSMLKLNRQVDNLNKIMSIMGSASAIGQSANNITSLEDTINRLSYTKTGKLTKSTSKLKYIDRLRDKQNYERGNISREAIGDTNAIVGLIKNNAPFYTSTSSKNVVSTGIENAIFGICYYQINNPINEYLVNEMIDENGYNVFEIIDDFNITGLFKNITLEMKNTFKYNYVKFDYINIYGKFPRSIAEVLENILLKGTKVWFNESEIS